jgi:hypothetical protein
MSAAILAILGAIPGIASFIEKIGPELGTLLTNLAAYIKHVAGDDAQGYVKRVGEAFSLATSAKTLEEREDAAQAIADAIHGLP